MLTGYFLLLGYRIRNPLIYLTITHNYHVGNPNLYKYHQIILSPVIGIFSVRDFIKLGALCVIGLFLFFCLTDMGHMLLADHEIFLACFLGYLQV
jgi:hypothetical protein